jgi:hypothetical protein
LTSLLPAIAREAAVVAFVLEAERSNGKTFG